MTVPSPSHDPVCEFTLDQGRNDCICDQLDDRSPEAVAAWENRVNGLLRAVEAKRRAAHNRLDLDPQERGQLLHDLALEHQRLRWSAWWQRERGKKA